MLSHETRSARSGCWLLAYAVQSFVSRPTAQGSGKGVSEIAVDVPFKTNRVKIYIDSKAVPGWNEIDAVGVRDAGGKTHWATGADASSTYAEQGGGVIFIVPAAAPVP